MSPKLISVMNAQPHRDSQGRTLEEYPRPSVAVDTAVLTVTPEARLCVLLTPGPPGEARRWRLPGAFLHAGETLAEAVLRSLDEKAGVRGLAPKQLHVFDDPRRDDRGWVLSVGHVDIVRSERIPSAGVARLFAVDEVPALPYDHGAIITFAVEAMRAAYRTSPDPGHLLPDAWPGEPTGAFTIRELRRLHESVLGVRVNADTFRRTMLPALVGTGRSRSGARGKPAELYLRGSASAAHGA